MPYIAARCPQCAGDLQLNSDFKKGYCIHCNTPVFYKEAINKMSRIKARLNKIDLTSIIDNHKKDTFKIQ